MAKLSADPIAMRPDKPPSRFGYYLVNSALVMLSPILAAMLWVRMLRGKSIQGWSERWGDWLGTDVADVWVHAASVGEVLAVKPILERYKALRPDDQIVISVVTPGGHEVAVSTLIGLVREVRYAPFDVPFAIKRIVRVVKPKLFVCVETELWPNLAHLVSRSGARLALVNGRISDRSFRSYARAKWLTRWILGHFHAVMAQSAADKGRLNSLGAPNSRLTEAGNAKYDQVRLSLSQGEAAELKRSLRIPPNAQVLAVGSTRQVDEEEIILRAYLLAREHLPELAIIFAPRHVERADQLIDTMLKLGLAPVRKSEMSDGSPEARHIVLDTFGELASIYAAADVAFIGNSLTSPGGGQNLLQPLAQGKAVLYGPFMQNFRDAVALAEVAGVGKLVTNAPELASEIVRILHDGQYREKVAIGAARLIEQNRGAADRYAIALVNLITTNDRA